MRHNFRPASFTPTWHHKNKAWYIYNTSGTSIASFKPLSDDLIDILHAYLLATKAADRLSRKHFASMLTK